ncbi:hypothetical protein [endosymbiont GvMRE of Glomus versiforme]|uniref:hypothetical protein n=1 Tax=endosymbiont GvMRE of Glomus versiforme TaxID=2039283 RepID=UPI000EE2C656|nr:hypothetical protein [endosymbiont GvMRE of Glomus versiforme]RHZ37348.1 hypothetical protein GvMRE_I1g280 [endosymbiont GvMRE of Glomus versiforme]
MNKCQKCGAKATTQLELNDKNKGEKTVLILCDVCYKEEIICQECKQEIKTLEIKQTTKTDGSTVRVCEECDKKIQLVKEWVAKIKNLKQELEKYVEFGEHRLADGTVIRGATCNIKENLTKEQLLAFKELLETNLTDKKAPTAGGEFLGWKRGTPEIEEALKVAEGTGIRQPYCYWLGVKEKIEELEKQEHLSNQEREREREREEKFNQWNSRIY